MNAFDLERLEGLDAAKRVAQSVIRPESAVHALLLYGAPGVGKTTLARYIVASWLCTNPQEVGPCRECQACGSHSRNNNGDFLLIEPIGAGRQIRIGQIDGASRDEDMTSPSMREFLRFKPLFSRFRVVMLDDVDRLNNDSSNSLLKSLEEPRPHVRFVLVTSDISRVRATIVSRCVSVACEAPLPGPCGTLEAALHPGERHRFAPAQDAIDEIWSLAPRLLDSDPLDVPRLAEQFLLSAAKVNEKLETGARLAQAESVRILALSARSHQPERFEPSKHLASLHRVILGNGNASLAVESVFAQIAIENHRIRNLS